MTQGRRSVRCHAIGPRQDSACDECGTAHAGRCATRRAVLSAAFAAVPLFAAPSALAGGLPSPTAVDEMEMRKAKREEVLKAARAKAAAQAAAQTPPPAAADDAPAQ